MHVLDNTYEESIDETLIRLLLKEKPTRKVLSLLQDKQMSVLEICSKCDFSTSLIYRIIHDLEDVHMLYVSGKINSDGKKTSYYQSKIKSFNLIFADGETHLEIIYNRRFLDNI